MIPLYKITDELVNLLASCDDDGEISPELIGKIDSLFDDLDLKYTDVLKAHIGYLKESEAFGAEAKRLGDLAKSAAKKADWLKEYLKSNMMRMGRDHVHTPIGKLAIAKNSIPTVTLKDGVAITELPREFQRVKVELDKTVAIANHKAGLDNPPAIVITHGYHLRIT